jgi:hypothetical protein
VGHRRERACNELWLGIGSASTFCAAKIVTAASRKKAILILGVHNS